MCYLNRDRLAAREPEDATVLPRPEGRRHRRLAGAVVMLIGGMALATSVDAPTSRTGTPAEQASPSVTVSAQAFTPVAGSGSGTSQPVQLVDDDVPKAPGEPRSAAAPCDHGM